MGQIFCQSSIWCSKYYSFFIKSCKILGKNPNTWNINRLDNESFVPSAHRTSVLYSRLSDFKKHKVKVSSCSCWIKFCHLNFFQKFPNFFGGENWHQMGYFDIKLSLIKVASGLGGSKDDQFSCFPALSQAGLNPTHCFSKNLDIVRYVDFSLSSNFWMRAIL